MNKKLLYIIVLAISLVFIFWYLNQSTKFNESEAITIPVFEKVDYYEHTISRDIPLRDYFNYMESLVEAYDSLASYKLDEYILAHANDWIIDTLASTDYYIQKKRNNFLYDSREMIILREKDTILIPTPAFVKNHIKERENTYIEINIPEFALRIKTLDSVLYKFPIRVGRNEHKYLKMAKDTIDLCTCSGKGEIIRVIKDPDFINPVDNKRYKVTRRDDGKVTKLPIIPWLEPEIDGRRIGQLIHPTTNQKTLGKPYSNGCIGTSEADAWRIYYYAPVGTEIIIKYDLEIINIQGDTVLLPDIYNLRNK